MTGNSPLLSFLCVSYNHEKFIEDCIKSIWNNDYKNIEILVLDDGSKDNSVQILENLAQKSPYPMRIITQKNTGNIGANFNKLIRESNGDYFSIISCDDMVIENTIKSKMIDLSKDTNLVYICHSKILGIDKYGNKITTVPPLKLDKYKNPTNEDILELDYEEIGSYYIQGAIYKKSIVIQIGGFDDDMICDDIIFRTKLSRYMIKHKELSFKVLHSPAIYYRRHNNNISSNSIRQLKGVLQYFQRYWSERELPEMFYCWLCSLDRHDLLDFLIEDKYKRSIIEHVDEHYLKRTLFPMDYPYKKQGIPSFFQILSYKNKNKKIKVIKLFNKKIYEYEKEII